MSEKYVWMALVKQCKCQCCGQERKPHVIMSDEAYGSAGDAIKAGASAAMDDAPPNRIGAFTWDFYFGLRCQGTAENQYGSFSLSDCAADDRERAGKHAALLCCGIDAAANVVAF